MPGQQESIFVKYNYPLFAAALGFGGCCLANYRSRKPLLAGIHFHMFCTSIAGLAGYGLGKYADSVYSERDARIRHYMEMYPEDFVETKRKYKDIFDEWIPCR